MTVLRRRSVHYARVPFHGLIEAAADRWPETLALLYQDQRYTFRELDGLASSLARALRRDGLGPGARVALYLSNRPEWIIALLAVHKAGAAAVLISPAWKLSELQHALALTRPQCIVSETALADFVRAAGLAEGALCADDPPPAGWRSLWEQIDAHPGRRLDLELDVERTEAVLPFSSGTTGLPKAVRHVHASLVTAALQWKIALAMGEADRLQTFTPLAHILGVVNLGAGLASGATHRLFARFDVDAVLQSIERDRITLGIAVAPVALALANHPALESFDLSSLRYFCWCATPVAPEVAERFSARTGLRWLTAYGATEAVVLTANPVHYPQHWRLDTPGLPGADVELRIVDLKTHEPLPPGQPGEVVVRGPNVMAGYLPEEANAGAFLPGGWYRTGDVGWVEPEGWLHLTDRVKEMIKVSGFQVAPAEVEAALLAHPGVADCAVYGVPDTARGQIPRAAVVRRPGTGVSGPELIEWAGARLAGYKRLSAVEFVDEIPRTASGKALRRVLVERYLADAPPGAR
jgi:acyl-CoA synthetase (AMP-forming)/AMP-acid ligase II